MAELPVSVESEIQAAQQPVVEAPAHAAEPAVEAAVHAAEPTVEAAVHAAEPAVEAPMHTSEQPLVEATIHAAEPAVEAPMHTAEQPLVEAAVHAAEQPAIVEAAPPPAVESEVVESEISSAPRAAAEAPSLAVEQALALEHALDAQHPPAMSSEVYLPVNLPQPEFSSPGSEMPVVLTTPVPYERPSSSGLSTWWSASAEFLPRARNWSSKTLRATPKALVVSAPFVALFGIWAAHSLSSHPKHAATKAASVQAPAPALKVTPVASSLASAFLTTAAPLPTAPSAAIADAEELASARAHGLPALEALAAKFPGDAQVGIALASQQAQAQRYEAAISTVEHVLTLAPSDAQNGKVMGILWRAAQSPASEQSFATLRKLGGRGTDISFDLATTPGVRDAVRERAKAELTNYLAFDASDDTRVATALLLAPDCSTRKSLLERAEREGGKRTLALLDRFAHGTVCTSSTDGACNSCMMGSPVLAHALATLGAGAKP